MRAIVPRAELRATALGRSASPTIRKTSVCRDGLSTRRTSPWKVAITYTCQSATLPVSVSTASVAAPRLRSDSVTISSRRTSKRSITEPTKSPNMVTGSACASASEPTATGEPVSSSTSQYAAICCIHVPENDTAWLKK